MEQLWVQLSIQQHQSNKVMQCAHRKVLEHLPSAAARTSLLMESLMWRTSFVLQFRWAEQKSSRAIEMLVIAILPTKDPKSRMTPTCTSCAPPEAFCATPMLADIKRSRMILFAISIWGVVRFAESNCNPLSVIQTVCFSSLFPRCFCQHNQLVCLSSTVLL